MRQLKLPVLFPHSPVVVTALMTTLLLSACGGGGSNSESPPPVDDDPQTLYSVGGTVTGLQGDLVLANNGADSLAVGGISFEFDTQLADGVGYAVTVESHPETQICAVDNASGTIDHSDINNVSILCRAWGTPELIDTAETNIARVSDIAVDGNGNAIAVWTKYDGDSRGVWAKRYTSSTGWGAAELVGSHDAGSAQSPRVVVGDDGNAITVWTEVEAGPVFIALTKGLWANSYTASSGWGVSERMDIDDAQSIGSARVGFDGSGNAVLIWGQLNEEASGFHFGERRFTPANGWGMPRMIEPFETGFAIRDYRLAVDDSGTVSFIWRQYNQSSDYIRVRHYTPGVGWGTAELIDTPDGGNNLWIATNSSGHVIALWDKQRDRVGSGSNIRASRYTPSGGWEPVELVDSFENGGISGQSLRVVMDDSGNAIAVWDHRTDSAESILAKRYTPDAGWGAAEVLETGVPTHSGGHPQIAMDSNGNAIALWERYDEADNSSVWMRRYTVVDGWGMAESIEIPEEVDAGGPRIVFDDTGDAIAVWTQWDETHSSVWSSRFD